jgi:HEAT repeat protein
LKRARLLLALVVAAGGLARAAVSHAQEAAATAKSEKPAKPDKPDKKSKKAKGANAAPGTPAPAASLPAGKLEALRLALVGADDAAAIEAAGTLGASGSAAAAEPLIEILAAGATPARLQAALDALAKLGEAHVLRADQTMIDALTLYSGHRAPDVRRRALRVLGTLNDPRVIPPLVERLGDAAPDVRGAAAASLAERREAKAAPKMFSLLARGDAGVAAPLALLATPDMIPRIAELTGTIDDAIVADALGEYVKRGDVPDKLRVDVLRTIGRLSGAVATTALVEYVASIPAKEDRPSKKEAQKLIDARGTSE